MPGGDQPLPAFPLRGSLSGRGGTLTSFLLPLLLAYRSLVLRLTTRHGSPSRSVDHPKSSSDHLEGV
jgi:hypothetical protein